MQRCAGPTEECRKGCPACWPWQPVAAGRHAAHLYHLLLLQKHAVSRRAVVAAPQALHQPAGTLPGQVRPMSRCSVSSPAARARQHMRQARSRRLAGERRVAHAEHPAGDAGAARALEDAPHDHVAVGRLHRLAAEGAALHTPSSGVARRWQLQGRLPWPTAAEGLLLGALVAAPEARRCRNGRSARTAACRSGHAPPQLLQYLVPRRTWHPNMHHPGRGCDLDTQPQ